MSDRFPAGDFDAWAETYDQSVLNTAQFPFVGYPRLLETIVDSAAARAGMRVLDLGTGTGLLAAPFAELGCELWATDYSPKMLEKARLRLNRAQLVQADLREGWPEEIFGRFDCIVSGYVFHHFETPQKIAIILDLVHERLLPGGKLIIGDIAFANAATLAQTRQDLGDDWEDEEYWIVDQELPALRKAGLCADFIPISYCAGVFVIQAVMR